MKNFLFGVSFGATFGLCPCPKYPDEHPVYGPTWFAGVVVGLCLIIPTTVWFFCPRFS